MLCKWRWTGILCTKLKYCSTVQYFKLLKAEKGPCGLCLAVKGQPINFSECITLVLHLHLKLPFYLVKNLKVMSGHDNEDLIDYEDEHDIPNVGATSTTNGATTSSGGVDEKDKKNFSGIHSTGFRYFLHLHIILAFQKLFFAEIFFSSQSCCVRSVTWGSNTPQKVGSFFDFPNLRWINCANSATGVHSTGCSWNGCSLPSQIWSWKNSRLCACHITAA